MECARSREDSVPDKTLAQLRCDRSHRRCTCPIHAEGTLRIDGFIRKSTGEVKWDEAQKVQLRWETAGTVSVEPPLPEPDPEPPTVEHAIEQFTNDRKALGVSTGTLKNIDSSSSS